MMTYNKLFHKFIDFDQLISNDEEAKKTYTTMGNYCYENEKYTEAFECFFALKDYARATDSIQRLMESVNLWDSSLEIIKYLDKMPSDYTKIDSRISIMRGLCYLFVDDYKNASQELYKSFNSIKKTNDNSLQRDLVIGLGIIETINRTPFAIIFFRIARHLSPNSPIIKKKDILCFLTPSSLFLFGNSSPFDDKALIETIDYMKKITSHLNEITNRAFSGYDDLYYAKVEYAMGNFNKALEYSMKTLVKTMSSMSVEIRLDALFLRLRIMILKGDYENFQLTYEEILNEGKKEKSHTVAMMVKYVENWVLTKVYNLNDVESHYMSNRKIIYNKTRTLKSNELINHAFMYIKREEFSNALGIISSVEEEIGLYKNQWFTKLSVNILKAISYYSLNEKHDAYEYLWNAYKMTHDYKIIAPFIEYGSYMRNLMNNIEKKSDRNFDKSWIDIIRKRSSYYAKHVAAFKKKNELNDKSKQNLIPSLTSKEIKVLKFLAQGFTIQEISKVLFISSSAVKKHATSIYEKLGASNRAEAIHIAVNNNLI